MSRGELFLGDGFLHEGATINICSYCTDLCAELFEAPGPEPAVSARCTYCGRDARKRLVAGPTVAVCDECIATLRLEERPSWGTVCGCIRHVSDAACFLALLESHWESLAANGIPIRYCARNLQSLRALLKLSWGASYGRPGAPWVELLEDASASDAPSDAAILSFVTHVAANGVQLTR